MKNGTAYSHEQKGAIIQEHTERHRTLREICEEYGISKSYLCYLLKQYRENGKKGIASTKYYSVEFKLEVVRRHYEDGATIVELVNETGIQYRMIKEWLSRTLNICYESAWYLLRRIRSAMSRRDEKYEPGDQIFSRFARAVATSCAQLREADKHIL